MKKSNVFLLFLTLGFGSLAIFFFLHSPTDPQPDNFVVSIGGWLSLLISVLSVIKLIKEIFTTSRKETTLDVIPYTSHTGNFINAPVTATKINQQVNHISETTVGIESKKRGKYLTNDKLGITRKKTTKKTIDKKVAKKSGPKSVIKGRR